MASEQTRFSIEVTEEDIEKAKRNDSYTCVVAQAIARTITDAHHIDVDSQSIRFTRGAKRYLYLTPYAVQGYVVAFDAGDLIEPFSFHLREPAKVKTQRLTTHGRKITTATQRARRAAKKRAQLLGQDVTSPEVVADVHDAVTAAYHAAKQEAPGEKVKEYTGEGRAAVIPRVFKRKLRSYGHRVLRINQQGKPWEEGQAAEEQR